MKRTLIVLAMMTGIVAVMFWTAPISAKNIHDLPYQAKQVVFESQLMCICGEGFCNGCSEECGGEVTVFRKNGETFVEFDFMTPLEGEEYYLYIGRNYFDTYEEIQLGDIVWDDTAFPPAIDYIIDPVIVTADENGECHTGPIELYGERVGFPPGFEIVWVTFSVKSTSYVDYVSNVDPGARPDCGEHLSTGFKISGELPF